MSTAIKLAAAGLGLAVVWRLYQASRFNVSFGAALRHPLAPIASLQVFGAPAGTGSLLDIAAHPQTRSGRGHF